MEKALKKGQKNIKGTVLRPMNQEEFNNRIDQSLSDSENGRLTENGDLDTEMREWS